MQNRYNRAENKSYYINEREKSNHTIWIEDD